MRKVGVVIDGAHASALAHTSGIQIDWRRWKAWFETDEDDVLRQYYVTLTMPPDESGQVSLRPLLDYLTYNGYTIVTKEQKNAASSMNVEFAVTAMQFATNVDELVLVTGNGDFAVMVDAIKRTTAARVVVVSTIEVIADNLRRAADEFIDFKNEIAAKVARAPRA